jgi:integrase/recombinase XerD
VNLLPHLPGHRCHRLPGNGGTIEHAQAIANHESPKTTKLYDRTSDQITLDEVERIVI